MSDGPLAGLSIVDLTDERGIYGVKLLADLGAAVVRPEVPAGDPLRARGPHAGDVSLWYTFFASSRRTCALDPASDAGRENLRALIESADMVISCPGVMTTAAAIDSRLRERPELVHIETSSFGPNGPWRDFLAPDLVAGALGGSVATNGDVDTPPLKTAGELNFMVSGAYTAIAALAARNHQQATGDGQRADVSVHECIASCLEHVLMWHWYARERPLRPHPALPRRGSLHWSNAYVVMQARGGSIMVTPTPNMDAQLAWLVEEDAHGDIFDEKYQDPANMGAFITRFMELLANWVATKDVEELFHAAQERHCPFGWVLPIEKVAENPQLQARDWWVDYDAGGTRLKTAGTPFHFSATPWQTSAPAPIDASNVIDTLGWKTSAQGSAQATHDRPLEGVKVLDFSHVLAGPFATRILADMGADVVRVNSAERATGANMPGSAYYAMWNRNKRSLALDMSTDGAKPIAHRLVQEADIVIDNFSVGVLDRWGIGFEAVSNSNPGVIYVEMSGMGDTGPWSKYVTFAPTIHALAGLTHLTGVPGREDIGIGFSYNDHQAGLHGTVALLAALEARRRTGQGQRVDISQFEVGVNFNGPALMDYFANGVAARPTANGLPYDNAAPHNCFPCHADGADILDERWIAIACMTDAQWEAFKGVMGSPTWADDPALGTAPGRVASETLESRVAEWTRGQDVVDLMSNCQAAGVPAGVVQDSIDMVERDPQFAHDGFLKTLAPADEFQGETYYDRLAIRFAKTPCDDYRPVSPLGSDNTRVLTEWIGLTEEQIADADAADVLR